MKVYYSCVVDCNYKFQYQGWLWVNSLIFNAMVNPKNIWIHCIKGVDEEFKKLCMDLGVNTIQIEPFGDTKYCNKISQLSNLSLRDADIIVLMDTDTFVLKNFEADLDTNYIYAKPVDTATPKLSVFDELFSLTKLKKSFNDIKATCMDEYTGRILMEDYMPFRSYIWKFYRHHGLNGQTGCYLM